MDLIHHACFFSHAGWPAATLSAQEFVDLIEFLAGAEVTSHDGLEERLSPQAIPGQPQ